MKKIIQGLLLLLLFTSSISSFADEIKISAIVPKPIGGLPKTGQTIQYQTYDDGDYQMGTPVSGYHYKDNLNGTITDYATGLMWAQDPSLCGGTIVYDATNLWASDPGTPRQMTWADAITNCEALSYAGHNDWRLPNVRELQSIVDYGRYEPSIDTSFFTSVPSTYTFYWSSTTHASVTGVARDVDFHRGDVISSSSKDAARYVRPVRSGSAP